MGETPQNPITPTPHFRCIASISFQTAKGITFSQYFEESCRLEQTNALLFQAEQFLRENRILRPGTSTLERIISEQRTVARQHIFQRITQSLPTAVKERLDALLFVGDDAFSPLQRLKEPPGAPSASAMNGLMDKLARIEETGILKIDLSWLNNNYQRSLAAYVRHCDAHRLREVEPSHRYGAMVCFLWQTYQDTLDFVIDLHDKLIQKMENRAQEAFNLELVQKRKSITESLALFQMVAAVILDEAVADEKVRAVVFSQVEKEELEKTTITAF